MRLARQPGFTWLDGGLTHGREGRFSFLASAPVELREAHWGEPNPLGLLAGLSGVPNEALTSEAWIAPEDVPRWVGHIAYDAHEIAGARFHNLRAGVVPLLHFARYDALLAFDHEQERGFLVGDDARACAHLADRLKLPAVEPDALHFSVGPLRATPAAQHRAAIGRALGHVRAGDVYQINLARRFAGAFDGSSLGLFLGMRAQSPVPLGFFQQGAEHAVLGRSMERFLRYRVRDRALWTSPIKGTVARRGDDAQEAHTLRSDHKEHAEHTMVIDLMRNDLSRVCEVGSVAVEDAFTVLPFAGLSHLISTVTGRARTGLTLDQLLSATFPPGSVTGTPKARALALIEELEDAARGIYTGALGFVDRAGGLSLSVAIRTAVISRNEVEYFAGGGIVWGSEPERETAETELKAQVFLNALEGEQR